MKHIGVAERLEDPNYVERVLRAHGIDPYELSVPDTYAPGEIAEDVFDKQREIYRVLRHDQAWKQFMVDVRSYDANMPAELLK